MNIHAKTFVLAAGAVLTPQILFNSGIRPKALGRYLCEQPLVFCQIVLLQSILDKIKEDYHDVIKASNNPEDPIPIPLRDPPPQVCNLTMYVVCNCLYSLFCLLLYSQYTVLITIELLFYLYSPIIATSVFSAGSLYLQKDRGTVKSIVMVIAMEEPSLM